MPYAKWLPTRMPTSLRGSWGDKLTTALGAELDQQADALRSAVRAAFPKYAPTDALPYIGAELSLPRGAGETDDAYATRLTQSWAAWKRAGSHPALLEQLKLAGVDYANMFLIQANGRRSSINGANVATFADGPIWRFDGADPESWTELATGGDGLAWNKFGLLFTTNQPALTYSSGIWSPLAATVNQICWKWRPARMRFMGTQIIVSGPTWGWPTTRTWGGGDTWGGGTTRFIPPR
jgi:hypothetical protein